MLKQLAMEKTMPLIDEPPGNWKTFNDKLNTNIVGDKSQLISKINLGTNEEPILECVLPDSLLVVTTERVVSEMSGTHDEVWLNEFDGFGNDYEYENNKLTDGRLPKTNLITIKRINKGNLYFRIDSYYPAHFVKVLIQNLASYQKNGKWFWNPKSQAN